MKISGLLLTALLCGCTLNSVAVPKTIALEAGTSVRHDAGEVPTEINTVTLKALWELRK